MASKYEPGKCREPAITTTEQVYGIPAVANIVAGLIVIPHTRRQGRIGKR